MYVFHSEWHAFLYTGGVSINSGVKKGAPDAKLHYYHWRHRVVFTKQTYDIVQRRFGIGSSTVTLIMKRVKEMGLSIDDLKQMDHGTLKGYFIRRKTDEIQVFHCRILKPSIHRWSPWAVMRIWPISGWITTLSILTAISSFGFTSCTGTTSKKTLVRKIPRCLLSGSSEKKSILTGSVMQWSAWFPDESCYRWNPESSYPCDDIRIQQLCLRGNLYKWDTCQLHRRNAAYPRILWRCTSLSGPW